MYTCFSSKFIRFKAKIDITKPLLHGIIIKINGTLMCIPIKYECFPYYYFCCGVIGYFFKNCDDFNHNEYLDSSNYKYGLWLRASHLKGSRPYDEPFTKLKHSTSKDLFPSIIPV